MSTKMGFWGWALVGAALLVASGPASASRLLRAGVTTNESTAVLIYPKVVVDPDVCQPADPQAAADWSKADDGKCSVSGETCNFVRNPVNGAKLNDAACDNGAGVDTLISLTNTSNDFRTRVLCYFVNANGHCDNAPDIVCDEENFRTVCPTGGLCRPGWEKTDFRFTLTKRQPISWSALDDSPRLPCDENSTQPCDKNQRNQGVLAGVPEIPFRGELICVQLVATDNPGDADIPIDRNDLKGEASIVTVSVPEVAPGQGGGSQVASSATIDARKYNALGIPAVPGRVNQDQILLRQRRDRSDPRAVQLRSDTAGVEPEPRHHAPVLGLQRVRAALLHFHKAELLQGDPALRHRHPPGRSFRQPLLGLLVRRAGNPDRRFAHPAGGRPERRRLRRTRHSRDRRGVLDRSGQEYGIERHSHDRR
jgi:hypothetical protein